MTTLGPFQGKIIQTNNLHWGSMFNAYKVSTDSRVCFMQNASITLPNFLSNKGIYTRPKEPLLNQRHGPVTSLMSQIRMESFENVIPACDWHNKLLKSWSLTILDLYSMSSRRYTLAEFFRYLVSYIGSSRTCATGFLAPDLRY